MTAARKCCLVALALLVAPVARGQKGKATEPLEEIRALLAGPKEEKVKEGAQRGRQLNTADSIQLLLDAYGAQTRTLDARPFRGAP